MIAHSFEVTWTEFHPVIEHLANRYGASNKRWGADHEDFKQEAIAWMLENEKFLSDKRVSIGDDHAFTRFLATCIENEMRDHAVTLRDQAGGQPRQGAYFYGTNELKALLPSMFDRSKWHEPPQSEEGKSRSKGIPSHGNNWVTTLADVSRAYSQLRGEDRRLLELMHGTGIRNKDLAEEYQITEAAMSSRHSSALKRLQDLLGGPKPQAGPPGSSTEFRRRAMSNAQSRAIQSAHYEESA